MDINEKLNNLTEKSIWYFAKQETSFDKVFDACSLLAAYPNEAATDVFETHKGENGVVSNYRILSVAQFVLACCQSQILFKGMVLLMTKRN